MSVKRILLTGDDGYNSIGIRLLIRALHKDYDLTIAATKEQQSAVGGKLNVKHGGTWNETIVDGIQALWVDGTPSDAIECANVRYPKFDLTISGMNMGENVGFGTVASGTVSAAQRAIAVELSPKAISTSWMTPPEFFFMKHDETEDIGKYFDYPGDALKQVVLLAIKEEMWGARMLNINLPKTKPNSILFTRFLPNANDGYPPVTVRDSDQTYAYPFEEGERTETNKHYDVAALVAGYIAITPQTPDWTDEKVYKKVKDLEVKLE